MWMREKQREPVFRKHVLILKGKFAKFQKKNFFLSQKYTE